MTAIAGSKPLQSLNQNTPQTRKKLNEKEFNKLSNLAEKLMCVDLNKEPFNKSAKLEQECNALGNKVSAAAKSIMPKKASEDVAVSAKVLKAMIQASQQMEETQKKLTLLVEYLEKINPTKELANTPEFEEKYNAVQSSLTETEQKLQKAEFIASNELGVNKSAQNLDIKNLNSDDLIKVKNFITERFNTLKQASLLPQLPLRESEYAGYCKLYEFMVIYLSENKNSSLTQMHEYMNKQLIEKGVRISGKIYLKF